MLLSSPRAKASVSRQRNWYEFKKSRNALDAATAAARERTPNPQPSARTIKQRDGNNTSKRRSEKKKPSRFFCLLHAPKWSQMVDQPPMAVGYEEVVIPYRTSLNIAFPPVFPSAGPSGS